MLSWVVTFLVVALIAGILGFGGIAGASDRNRQGDLLHRRRMTGFTPYDERGSLVASDRE